MDFYTYKARLNDKGLDSVYDGDTISKLIIDTGFNTFKISSFRLLGIDTPEIRTKSQIEKTKGYQARDLLRTLIGDNQIAIKSISAKGTGKYGRVLGELYIANGPDAWMNAGFKLIDVGMAVPYYGGTKTKDWSEDKDEIEMFELQIQRIKEGKDEFIKS